MYQIGMKNCITHAKGIFCAFAALRNTERVEDIILQATSLAGTWCIRTYGIIDFVYNGF